jgi:hypothetical protein
MRRAGLKVLDGTQIAQALAIHNTPTALLVDRSAVVRGVVLGEGADVIAAYRRFIATAAPARELAVSGGGCGQCVVK